MRASAVVAAAICLLCAGAAAAQDVVGVVKRVRGAAELIAVEGRDKLLAPGDQIRANDVVKTGMNGSALLQLLDATVFTIGANAEIKVDRFVYDPDRAASGFIDLSVLQGAMRIVSGTVAKQNPGAMQVALPFGTIGIRGTIALLDVSGDGASIILLDPQGAPPGGALLIQTPGGATQLSAPGEGVRLVSETAAPPQPRTWSDDEINAILSRAGGGVYTRPRGAGPGGSGTQRAGAGAQISREDCVALLRDSATYQPGMDVRGNRVTSSDILGGSATQDFTINLTIDALAAAGVDTRFDGVEGTTSLGQIEVRNGQAYVQGGLLNPDSTNGLRQLCQRELGLR